MLTFGGLIIFTTIFFWSCHLDDFNLKKLAVTHIRPVIYTPLAYGGYTVGDQFTTPLLNTDTIKVAELDLNPIIYDKSGVSFSLTGMDSVYLVVHFTNETPMKMQVLFDFTDQATGTVNGKIFDSGLMQEGQMDATGKVIQPADTEVIFPMDSNDLNNITLSDGIEFKVKLFQPDTGAVIVKNLKASEFKVQISMRAPLSL